MINYQQEGHILQMTAPSGGTVAGLGYLIGNTFLVAIDAAAQTLPFRGRADGVFTLTKQGGAGVTFAEGARVSYDNANKRCVAPGTGMIPIGVAVAAAANGDTAVVVRLDGISTAAA
jgi:predicted RecA/RadA family phage recombinase